MAKNNSLRWLHLSDIHMGCPGREVWWGAEQEFAKSLQNIIKKRGNPDLILITGDIVWSGQSEEFELFDQLIEKVLGWLGSKPLIIPVPGNHDLLRPDKSKDYSCYLLDHFPKGNDHPAIKDLNEKLWINKDPSFFNPLFQNYQTWLEKSIFPQFGVELHRSHFPGDLSVKIQLPDRPPLTVVGLNSAWRHYGDLKAGELEIFNQQLFYALGENQSPYQLLLMHHPVTWFSPFSLKRFREDIYSPERFLACLHGHMHEGRSESTVILGGAPRHYYQSPSLFGMEKYGTANESRAIGYTWGELDGDGGIRVWPMAYRLQGGVWTFVFDQSFVGNDSTGSVLRQGTRDISSVEEVDRDEMAAYRAWALAKYGSVSMIGTGGAELVLDLAKVYVPLRISQRSLLADHDQRKERPGKEFSQKSDGHVALAEVFKIGKGRHVAMFGDPGAGKSTAMRKLLHHCLVEGAKVLGLDANTMPIFLRLRRFSEEFLLKPLSAFVESELGISSGQSLATGLGDRLWRRGGLLLLLDGLDEIADLSLRAKVARKLEDSLLGERSRGVYAAVSCRYAGYGGPVRLGGSFLHLDVQPLDDEQVNRFVHLWFQEAHICLPKGDPEQAKQDASKLLRNLGEARYANQQIKLLVGNPLLLTLLCVVVLQKYEIPRRRVEFYRQCLEVLLYRWRYLLEEGSPPLALEAALAVLRLMAWTMHSQGRQYDLTEWEFADLAEGILEKLGGLPQGLDGFKILRWLHVTCGVLEEYAPQHFGFMHLGFQEYLAACHVASKRQELVEILAAKAAEKWWREVILLLAGLEDRDLFVCLANALLPNVLQTEQAELLRDVVAEAPLVELEPFLKRLQMDQDADTQMAVLRVLLGRSESHLREAAAQLVQVSKHSGVQDLARRFLDRGPMVEGGESKFDLLLVFLPADQGQAERLETGLRREGVRVWPIRDEGWKGQLEKCWPSISVVAILVGENIPWQQGQISAALSLLARRGRRLLPVHLGMMTDTPALPAMMKENLWIHFKKGNDNHNVAQLVKAIQTPIQSMRVAAGQTMIEPLPGLRLLFIPGGEFMMGSSDGDDAEKPPHPVQLSPYWLGETPVTNRQYGKYLQETKSKEPAYWRDRRFSDQEQPVVGVSWQEAMDFCLWLSKVASQGQKFILPSEAQWEFAARGKEGRIYPWGADSPTKELACFGQDASTGKPAPVGSYPAGRGPFGHLDLAGNVWEWCIDRWSDDYSQWIGNTPLDPVVITGNDRILRGSSWGYSADVRSARRLGRPADGLFGAVGFRVAAVPAST